MKTYKNSYYIGIDGGATKTLVCLGDKSGDIKELIKLSGTNYQTVGIENTKKTIKKAMDILTKSCKIKFSEIHGICFGGAGVDSPEGVDIITNAFRETGYKNELIVCNDGVIALVGANSDYKGGVIIAGTGSVALGVDDHNELHKVGGWGHILDDRGSAYMIGKQALSKVMEFHDGRGRETKLTEKIKDFLEISELEEIIDFVYSKNTKKHHIAKLAPIVTELYEEDEVARSIIEEAIEDLECLILTLVENMKKECFLLGLYGSVLVKDEKIRTRLVEKIHSKYPNIDLHLPYRKAYIGALDIAIGKVKID